MGSSVAIITARGGSKRIPRKNIKLFLGKPIIQYSIEAAIDSGCFTEVMVSTDDYEIAELALKFGAKVPFMRSKRNSDDFSTTADVLLEVLEAYRLTGQRFECFCCIYPTAPFITPAKLSTAMNMLVDTGVDCVLPVLQFGYPIERCLRVEKNRAFMEHPDNYSSRSQDFAPAYHDAGQFYCLELSSFLEQRVLFPKDTLPMITSHLEVQDIDTDDDWELAEFKYQYLKKTVE
jgi:pseudaminic acid cytidylyltransferase